MCFESLRSAHEHVEIVLSDRPRLPSTALCNAVSIAHAQALGKGR